MAQSQVKSRKQIGLESQKKGRSFEEKVAELYRLLHYDVEHGRLFSGRAVDIFLSRRLGDIKIYRAIECKSGQISTPDLDIFLIKLDLVRKEYPSVQGALVSGVTFTDAVYTHAAAVGIQLTNYQDLAAQLFDGNAYTRNLIRECETNSYYPLSSYIEQDISNELGEDGLASMSFLSEWMNDDTWNQLTILGDLGTGKTFLTRVFSYTLAKKYIENPLKNPLPIRIDLRKTDREFSLEGLVLTHLAQKGLLEVSFDVFQYSLSEGNIILVLDGFDEMSARVTPEVTRRNFIELTRCIQGRAKILLTCRTHYFKSRTEEEYIILGNTREYKSESIRDLYWELISRRGFKIAYLRPFTMSHVQKYVYKVMPDNAKKIIDTINTTYNLSELSQRPLLLEMLLKSIDKIREGEINTSGLYEVFTDAWVYREQWREILPPEKKLNFLKILAFTLWQEDLQRIHHEKLFEYLKNKLTHEISSPHDTYVLDNEIRTATFLNRDQDGNYGFSHKSFAEFFIARYLASELAEGRIDCLRVRRFTTEIVSFLSEMIELSSIRITLENVLRRKYQPQLSENALMCLYGLKLKQDQDTSQAPRIVFPKGIKLTGARLDQVMLEGAVMKNVELQMADLSGAILIGVDLSGAILSGAVLHKAELQYSNLKDCNLSEANLSEANLEGSSLERANLCNANLDNAILLKAILKRADLRGAKTDEILISEDDIERFRGELDQENIEQIIGIKQQQKIADKHEFLSRIYPILKETSSLISRFLAILEADEILHSLHTFILQPPIFAKIILMEEDELKSYIIESAYGIGMDMAHEEGLEHQLMYVDPNRFDKLTSKISDPRLLVLREQLWELVEEKLSTDLFRIFKARFINDMVLAEIAKNEGVSISNIHRRINKGLRILQEELPDFKEFWAKGL